MIFKNGRQDPVKRVLVPVSGGPHSAFALEIADILVEEEIGEIVLLWIDTGKRRFDIARFADEQYHTMKTPPARVVTKTVRSHDVSGSIIRESAWYDLVVCGISNRPRMFRAVRETLPESIAGSCGVPLVLVKAQTGVRSLIRKLV